MSQESKSKRSLCDTNILRTKLTAKLIKGLVQHDMKSNRKLPFIKEKKYCSSKNLIVSSTCDITSIPEDLKIQIPGQFKNSNLNQLKNSNSESFKNLNHDFIKNSKFNKIKKRSLPKNQDKRQSYEIAQEFRHETIQKNQEQPESKQFFLKNGMHSIGLTNLKKYSSCNKLNSFPSIKEIRHNDDYYPQNQSTKPDRQIKSTNQIKLQTIQEPHIPKLARMPFKKILKPQLSKTINPRKLQSENSVEIQNEERTVKEKKRSKFSKDIFDRIDSRTKILVKNPFNRVNKKNSQVAEKFESLDNFQAIEKQFRLSKICQDNCSEVSISGKKDIENLIDFMNR